MSRFGFARRSRRVGFSLLVIGAFVLGSTLGPGVVAAANTAILNVFVTNWPTSQHVTVDGTPSVDIGNLPTSQHVTVDAIPSVNVGNLPPVSGTVNVGNSAANPIPVADSANKAVVLSCNVALGDGFNGSATAKDLRLNAFSVPAGKRLVIEEVSGHINLPVGESVLSAAISTGFDSAANQLTLMPQHQGDDATYSFFAVSEFARLYGDTSGVTCFVGRNPLSGNGTATFTIQGYLADLP